MGQEDLIAVSRSQVSHLAAASPHESHPAECSGMVWRPCAEGSSDETFGLETICFCVTRGKTACPGSSSGSQRLSRQVSLCDPKSCHLLREVSGHRSRSGGCSPPLARAYCRELHRGDAPLAPLASRLILQPGHSHGEDEHF